MYWGPGACSASYGAGLGQPGGERLWAPQVQQLHRAEQRLTPDEKTQAAAAEAEGFPSRPQVFHAAWGTWPRPGPPGPSRWHELTSGAVQTSV